MVVFDVGKYKFNIAGTFFTVIDSLFAARTTIFLHDVSVGSLDELLDPKRGKKSPHPFYIDNKKSRADVVEFLRGLDTDSTKMANNKKLAKK